MRSIHKVKEAEYVIRFFHTKVGIDPVPRKYAFSAPLDS
jgi:hypothetical protein